MEFGNWSLELSAQRSGADSGPDGFFLFFGFGGWFEDFAVAAIEECVVAGDLAGFEQSGDGLVDGAVAFLESDFQQADDLFEFAFADAGADGVVGAQDLGCKYAAGAVGALDQALADDAFDHAGELGDDLLLLIWREDIDEAVDGLRGIDGVQGGEDEVTGFRCGEGDFDALEIPETVIPCPNVVSAFDAIAKPARQRQEEIVQESSTLAGLRDTILPKLISGELRVTAAERIVGGAD